MSLDTLVAANALSGLSPQNAAVFLDFDGVLVDLAPTPDDVLVANALISLLAALETETEGACAIVTGRPVEDLRRHLPLVPHAVIGSHGAEGYLPGAPAFRHPLVGSDTIARMHDRAARAEELDGVMVERKPTGVALHYRGAPDHAGAVHDVANALVAEFAGFVMLPAKAAVEIRPSDIGKDIAVARAMALPVFAGRTPVYFGDDTTDEPALAWVADHGGVAVKVGPGDSVARHRLSGPVEVQAVLADWLKNGWRWE
ncbi:MAG: trehalose-phosphatase [Pseudomonadota bacterium]